MSEETGKGETKKKKNPKPQRNQRRKSMYLCYIYATTNMNLKELSVLRYDGGYRVNRSEMRQHFNSIKLFSAK